MMEASIVEENMEKEVYLHIGTWKTGTTSIQNFLNDNQSLLRANQISYVANGLLGPAHYLLPYAVEPAQKFHCHISQQIEGMDIDLVNIYRDVVAEISSSVFQRHIISSENFSMLSEGAIKNIASYFKGIKIKLIIYIRRQDFALESYYYESIRGADTHCAIMDFYDNHSDFFDYENIIGRFKDAFGLKAEDIIVRIFEKEQLTGGDSVVDFMSIFGVDVSQAIASKYRYNQRYPYSLIEFKRLLNSLPVHFDDLNYTSFIYGTLSEYLAEFLKENNAGLTGNLLSVEQRAEILEKHSDSNAVIALKYFGKKGKMIFNSDLTGAADERCEYHSLSLDQVVRLLGWVIISLQKETSHKLNLYQEKVTSQYHHILNVDNHLTEFQKWLMGIEAKLQNNKEFIRMQYDKISAIDDASVMARVNMAQLKENVLSLNQKVDDILNSPSYKLGDRLYRFFSMIPGVMRLVNFTRKK